MVAWFFFDFTTDLYFACIWFLLSLIFGFDLVREDGNARVHLHGSRPKPRVGPEAFRDSDGLHRSRTGEKDSRSPCGHFQVAHVTILGLWIRGWGRSDRGSAYGSDVGDSSVGGARIGQRWSPLKEERGSSATEEQVKVPKVPDHGNDACLHRTRQASPATWERHYPSRGGGGR